MLPQTFDHSFKVLKNQTIIIMSHKNQQKISLYLDYRYGIDRGIWINL